MKFKDAIYDDLDTPRALAVIWGFIREYNKKPQQFSARAVLRLLYDFDKVLGLGLKSIKSDIIPQKVLVLAKKREMYRKNNQWQKADRIRAQISSLGYQVEDTAQGQRIKKQ